MINCFIFFFVYKYRWMQERRIRITSTKAHRIKTRRTKFHELATSLTRPRTFSSAATSYGKD